MIGRLALSLAVASSVIAVAVPATAADTVGVNSCANSAGNNGPRGYCTMVTTPGVYTLKMTSTARYAWAEVECSAAPGVVLLRVARWNTDPGYPNATDTGYLPGPTCTLTVAGGSGGTAVAFLHPGT